MKIKISLLLIVSCVLLSQSSIAQDNIGSQNYQTSIGVKFYPGAISIKHFVSDKNALEGLAYFFNQGFRATGLYEIHSEINNAGGLNWYIGPGAHIGFYSNKYGGATSVGIDGVLGLDYKFRDAPINLSLDWQPSFEFGNKYNNGFNGNWGGLGIRYVL